MKLNYQTPILVIAAYKTETEQERTHIRVSSTRGEKYIKIKSESITIKMPNKIV